MPKPVQLLRRGVTISGFLGILTMLGCVTRTGNGGIELIRDVDFDHGFGAAFIYGHWPSGRATPKRTGTHQLSSWRGSFGI